MSRLNVEFSGLKLMNPVMPAAGPPVKDGEAAIAAAQGGAGAIVTKTISDKPAPVPKQCMAEIKGGFLNTELWSELSPEQWLEREYPRVKEAGLPVIVGLGYTAEQINYLAQKVAPFADALELSTHYLGDDPSPVVAAVKAAKAAVDLPVYVKLSPQIDLKLFGTAAQEAGADGLVLINSLGPCLDIDLETGKPLMGSKTGYGWLSGRAIFPVALRAVYEAYKHVDIPILGVGGISSGEDAVKMIMAGAQAVQICTAAILQGPGIYGKIARQLEKWLDDHGYESLEEIHGLAHKHQREEDLQQWLPVVDAEKCTACGACARSCVYHAIEIQDYAIIDEERCFGCGLCITRCKFDAISPKA
ncbi:MAG: 4Fe-4S dicluster domain-containing protein [Firmicutes bacterium]|nr:4Fe-4S dicluster domain-containing protein [Bacillota bacterium]